MKTYIEKNNKIVQVLCQQLCKSMQSVTIIVIFNIVALLTKLHNIMHALYWVPSSACLAPNRRHFVLSLLGFGTPNNARAQHYGINFRFCEMTSLEQLECSAISLAHSPFLNLTSISGVSVTTLVCHDT